ncbi:MAG: pilin [Cardiobacteriaceae bacterium]|nr:pilin [Cardiobacteriaceae bacterium]
MKRIFCTLGLFLLFIIPAKANVINPYIGIFGTTKTSGSGNIVLASIFAATALPLYQDYIAKSQIARVYGEIRAVQDVIDLALFEDKKPTLDAENKDGYENIGLLNENAKPRSDLVSKYELKGFENFDSDGELIATLGGKAVNFLHGTEIHLVRVDRELIKSGEASQDWICRIKANNSRFKWKFVPAGCSLE